MKSILRFSFYLLPLFTLFVLSGCAAPVPTGAESYEMAAMEAPAVAADSADYERTELVVADNLDRMMIGTANIDLVVADTGATVEEITALVTNAGGYVSDNNFYHVTIGEQELLQGNMTVRVPATMLDSTMRRMAALAVGVTNQSLSRQDVTDQYYDLDARLRNLQATETELLALLTEVRAKPQAKPDDILTVHRSLMEIRGEIEHLQGRRNMLDNQVALSTIYVSLQPDTSALPIVEESWRPMTAVNDALRSLVGSLQTLGNVAIWLVLYVAPVLLTILLPLVLVIWALIFVARRLRGRRLTAAS